MLTVSLVGKKFSCNIQLKIFAEKDGGGLELILKAGEKCSNRPQAISNVTASLHLTIQRGCNNYVTKCKEMLTFLQEQALPKTMNIIKVHMVNRETKSLAQKEESRLLSCIRPSKRDRERARDRSASRDRLSTRAKRKRIKPPDGYSSDSEQVYRHSYGASSDSLNSRQSRKTDIIATPRMSRHRLKNAALLRDRKQREASRERNEVTENTSREQEQKTKNTSAEIHLPLRENKKNKSKRHSVRSLETDFESQGELTYDGGSESSLRTQVMEDKVTEGKQVENVNVQSVKPENKEKDGVNGRSVTDSDMSVDSLECLDMNEREIQEKKKRKKRKVRKRAEEKLSSKEELTSSATSVASQIPLALPEDFQDSSLDVSDSNTMEEHDIPLKTKAASSLNSSSPSLCTDVFTKTLSRTAQQIVDDVICSALKKCEKLTKLTNLDSNFNQQEQNASVQSGVSINDDVIQGTKTAVKPSEIKLEFIEDTSAVSESKAVKELNVERENTHVGCVIAESVRSALSNDDRIKTDKLEGSTLDDRESSAVITDDVNSKDSDLQKKSSSQNQPADHGNANDAVVLVTQRGPPQDPGVQQDNLCHIKPTNEENSTKASEDKNKSSPAKKKTLDSVQGCSKEILTLDAKKNDDASDVQPDVEKPNCQSVPSSISEAETLANTENDLTNEKSSHAPEVEAKEGDEDKEGSVSNFPVKLYDTHVNITNRIINSVSQALHLTTTNTTTNINQSSYLNFDPAIPLAPHYTTPERGFEGYLSKELPLRSSSAESQPQRTKSAEEETPKREKSRVRSLDQKSEETFHRFVQSQRFGPSVESGSATDDIPSSKDPNYGISGINTSYINTSRDAKPQSGYCYFVVSSDSTGDNPQEFHKQSSNFCASADERRDTNFSVLEPRERKYGARTKSSVYHRTISEQNERKRWITSIQEPDWVRTAHQRSSSADARSRNTRNNKCVSCPVISEEDIVLEGLESHHKDVCNALAQRTWVVLRVHELWKAKKPLEALKMCMELTGIKTAEVSSAEGTNPSSLLDTMGSKDNALFLNILQQLPIKCSAWSLSMCDLLLPELKLFISTRRHTSHVDMACNVLQVIVKKVSGVVVKIQTENKEKPVLLKNCVAHLRDVSNRISQVLVARRGKIHTALTTEDPIALKPVLRELLSTIQTLLKIYVE